jgi:hypothetical protein
MKIPKRGSWWKFRGNEQGCGKNQQVILSSKEEVISWGEGFSWMGTPEIFFQLFTPEEPAKV